MDVAILLQVQIFRQQGVCCSMKKNFLGFTLVELMISMSIIAILSVVLSVSFSRAQKNGRDQRRISDLKAVQNAAEQMILLSGTYPTVSNFYRPGASAWTAGGQTVLDKFPYDPQYNSSTGIGPTYAVSGVSATGYCVCADLEVDSGNAASLTCDLTNKGGYFCIRNQQ